MSFCETNFRLNSLLVVLPAATTSASCTYHAPSSALDGTFERCVRTRSPTLVMRHTRRTTRAPDRRPCLTGFCIHRSTTRTVSESCFCGWQGCHIFGRFTAASNMGSRRRRLQCCRELPPRCSMFAMGEEQRLHSLLLRIGFWTCGRITFQVHCEVITLHNHSGKNQDTRTTDRSYWNPAPPVTDCTSLQYVYTSYTNAYVFKAYQLRPRSLGTGMKEALSPLMFNTI